MRILAEPGAAGIWIGLNDRNEPGTFEWADGSQVDYTAWVDLQPNPNTRAIANCVFKYYSNNKWHECNCERCTSQLVILCQTLPNTHIVLPS